MEPLHGRHKASMFPHEDVIGNMPDNVITNILDRLPLQEAVRTGILSRNWRFKWIMLISQLVFDDDFFEYLRKTNDYENNNQVRVIIGRLLLHLRGPITKCVLSVDRRVDVEDEDISHWILFLSRKGIKDLTIESHYQVPLKLPTHIFSCLELKHLKLYDCHFNPPPTFRGFPNLLSLELDEAHGERGGVLTRCLVLEILKLKNIHSSCKVKLDEIARLENLKILSLSLRTLDTMMKFSSSSTIFELLGSLPKLQELELNFQGCKVIEGDANKKFSIAFPCLMTLRLTRMYFGGGMKLSCAFDVIRSCPNLQTLEITANNWDIGPPPQEDYNTTGLLQLQSVMFEYLKGSENEVCLLKYLLASSPFLKQVVIRSSSYRKIKSDGKLKFASKLLKLHRASPVVDISLS